MMRTTLAVLVLSIVVLAPAIPAETTVEDVVAACTGAMTEPLNDTVDKIRSSSTACSTALTSYALSLCNTILCQVCIEFHQIPNHEFDLEPIIERGVQRLLQLDPRDGDAAWPGTWLQGTVVDTGGSQVGGTPVLGMFVIRIQYQTNQECVVQA